jgi:hypothetical protein
MRAIGKSFLMMLVAMVTVWVSVCLSNSTEAQERVVRYDSLEFSGETSGGVSFSLEISLRPFDAKDQEGVGFFWGTDGWLPQRVISNVSLTIAGERINVLRESLADLGDVSLPGGVYIMEAGDGLNVYLRGGDASTAYTAILEVVGRVVRARRIEFVDSAGKSATKRVEYKYQ